MVAVGVLVGVGVFVGVNVLVAVGVLVGVFVGVGVHGIRCAVMVTSSSPGVKLENHRVGWENLPLGAVHSWKL